MLVTLKDDTEEEKKKRIRKGIVNEKVKEIERRYGVGKISLKTIRARLHNGEINPKRGPIGPLSEVEDFFVQNLNELEAMNIDLSPPKALELVNSLIHGTAWSEKVEVFQRRNCPFTKEENIGKVSKGWFQRFLKRHEDEIESTSPVKMEDKRTKWCTCENMSKMYDRIYSGMESAGVATRLETPSYFDRGGNQVSEKEFAHRRKCEYVLTHAEMGILFD